METRLNSFWASGSVEGQWGRGGGETALDAKFMWKQSTKVAQTFEVSIIISKAMPRIQSRWIITLSLYKSSESIRRETVHYKIKYKHFSSACSASRVVLFYVNIMKSDGI